MTMNPTETKPTPLTDVKTFYCSTGHFCGHVVKADFARSLETKLREAEAREVGLREAIHGPENECTVPDVLRKLLGHLHSRNLHWASSMEMSSDEQNDWETHLETLAVRMEKALSNPSQNSVLEELKALKHEVAAESARAEGYEEELERLRAENAALREFIDQGFTLGGEAKIDGKEETFTINRIDEQGRVHMEGMFPSWSVEHLSRVPATTAKTEALGEIARLKAEEARHQQNYLDYDEAMKLLETERADYRAQVEKLQAFKDWVHAYLDRNGVPHHPPGTHGAEGCRIGDRMDWLMARVLQPAATEEGTRA